MTTDGVAAVLSVDGIPNGIAASSDAVWVALLDTLARPGGKLVRINLASGAVERTVPVPGVLSFTKRIGGSVWAVSYDRNDSGPGESLEVDWATGKVLHRLPFERPVLGLDGGGGALWLAVGRNPATLVRLDPSSRTQVGKPIELSPTRVIGIAYGEGAVWAAASEANELVRVDPATGRRTAVEVGGFPVGIAFAKGSVWVANRDRGTVTRVDPRTMSVTQTIDVGRTPTWIEHAGGSLWVSNQLDGTVTRIDPTTGEKIGAPIRIAASAADSGAAHVLSSSGDSLWVASQTGRSISRIEMNR